MARRVHRAKSFSFDLTADWRPFAEPPTEGSEWIYYGVCTLNGVTGALAWKPGWEGIAVASRPVEVLGMWERIAITNAVREKLPGWEGAPRWKPAPPSPSHYTPPSST